MKCVDHPVAIREHHKCAVFIQSEKCTLSGNVVRCQSVGVNKFLCVKCVTQSVYGGC